MVKRSRFFHTMTCFFTADQNSNPPKKKTVPKSKSKRNTNVLIPDHIPQILSKPKHRLQLNTAKSKPSKEIVDLTTEDDPMRSIHVQILDETLNMSPILIHMKTSPFETTNTFNTSQNVNSNDKSNIQTVKTSDDDVEISSLKEENEKIDDPIFIDMSVEQQNDPYNDVPLLEQSSDMNVQLSRDENNDTSCTDNQVREVEKTSVFEKIRNEWSAEKPTVDEKPSRKKNSEKPKRTRNGRKKFHASKIAYLSESESYYCFLCELSFKKISSHIVNDKYPRTRYKCSVCEQRFQWKAFLTRHLRQHFGTSTLESTMTSDETVFDNAIKSNPTADIPGLNTTTENVDETFKSLEQQLKSNNNSTHSSLIKLISDTDREIINLTCGYCDQCFPSQIALVEHCRTHMDDRPFICNICGTLFKQNAALVYHTRSHFHMIRSRGKKTSAPFIRYILRLHSCNDCDRSYISWAALNQHIINVHSATAERFVCEICEQVYYTMTGLRAHKRRNNCKKRKIRFTCESCGKSYCNKHLLRKHELKFHANVIEN